MFNSDVRQNYKQNFGVTHFVRISCSKVYVYLDQRKNEKSCYYGNVGQSEAI
jgi:hypothetical protein